MLADSNQVDALLRSRPHKVVPAAFFFDESSFAKHAQKCFQRVCDADLAKVIRCGSASDAAKVIEGFSVPGFSQSVAPLRLMDNVPGWCVWFLSSETTEAEVFWNALQALQAVSTRQFHYLLFLSIDQPRRAKSWVVNNLRGHYIPFLLSTGGAMRRTEHDLARAAATYAYAGWRRYWESGDPNLRAALMLSTDSRVWTLGMAASELDTEYHAQRVADDVLKELRSKLLARICHADPPAILNGIKDYLAFLLPDWYLATDHGGSPRSIRVQMGDEFARLTYLERKRMAWDGTLWHRRHFQRLLLRLKDKFCFLTFIALPNAKRFVQKKAQRLMDFAWPSLRDYLQPPKQPDSFLQVLAQRLGHSADYALAMGNTRIAEDAPSGSFKQDYKSAWTRISAIPNLLGAFLRLLLISIGLAGLLLAPLWWGGIRDPLADDILRYVATGSAGLLVVCILGVFGHYAYACWVADHHLELAETNLELHHLRDIGGLAIQKIREVGTALQKRFENCRDALVVLENALQSATVTPQRITKSPSASWLTDEGIDILLQPRLAELAQEAYERVANDLNSYKDTDGLVSLDPVLWQNLLVKHCVGASRDAFDKLTFDECAAVNPSTADRQGLIGNLVSEASVPAWPNGSDFGAPILCFADPNQWQPHCGQYNTLNFYKLRLKDMVMVRVIPLLEVGP